MFGLDLAYLIVIIYFGIGLALALFLFVSELLLEGGADRDMFWIFPLCVLFGGMLLVVMFFIVMHVIITSDNSSSICRNGC